MPEYVPLTQAHLDAWGAEFTADEMAGLALVDGDRVLALGGVRWVDGRAWCHFDAVPEASPFVHRAAVHVASAVLSAGETTLYAHCDETRPRARAWLERFGFVEQDGGVWVCELGSGGIGGGQQGRRGRRLDHVGPGRQAGGERGGSAT